MSSSHNERAIGGRRASAMTAGLIMLVLAALACNVPDGSGGDTEATVQVVYSTITAQAGMSPVPTDTPTEAATATPTTTGTPTVTPTPPENRTGNGDNLTIPRCTKTVTVDGGDADWKQQAGVTPFALTHNTFGEAEWQGADDLSGRARMCWIDSMLYLFVEVTDDLHVQTQQGRTAWKGDEVELVFDADLRGDFYDEDWNDDDTQLGFSPGDFGDILAGVMEYHPADKALDDVEIAARRAIGTGGDYVLEVAIPWSVLGVVPRADTNYGFCLAISDNDHVGEAQQDSMVSHCTDLSIPDPTTWVTLRLAP